MVRVIAEALDAFERDERVARVVVAGAGGRAFCAGGDIRRLYEQGRRRRSRGATDLLARGISTQPAHQALSQTLCRADRRHRDGRRGRRFAPMGRIAWRASAACSRCRKSASAFSPTSARPICCRGSPIASASYLAADGIAREAGDVVALGLAHSFVAQRRPRRARAGAGGGRVGRGDSRPLRRAAAAVSIMARGRADRVRVRSPRSRRRSSMRSPHRPSDGSPFAQFTRSPRCGQKSPTSQAIALRQMALGAGLSFEEAMRVEFRIVSRICRGHDFYEGVRAAIIDKDNRPRWRPGARRAARGERDRGLFRAARSGGIDVSRRRRDEDDHAAEPRRRDRDRRSRSRARVRRGAAPWAARRGCVGPDALVWFMRTLAWVWVAKGLFNWASCSAPFRASAISRCCRDRCRASIVFFAAVDLLAAVGLWLAAPWGGVVWLLCAAIESRFAGARRARRGDRRARRRAQHRPGALYFLLSWRAAPGTRTLTRP